MNNIRYKIVDGIFYAFIRINNSTFFFHSESDNLEQGKTALDEMAKMEYEKFDISNYSFMEMSDQFSKGIREGLKK